MYDNDLERAIGEVGRENVFSRARDLGWGHFDAPPAFVWWGIIAELRHSLTDVLPNVKKTL